MCNVLVTVPSGDIILEYGSPLEILCILNPSVVSQGFNSSNLAFYHTSFKVQPEFVTIVNESTARLYIEKPVPMKDMFYCKLANGTEESPVCLNSVAVGCKFYLKFNDKLSYDRILKLTSFIHSLPTCVMCVNSG